MNADTAKRPMLVATCIERDVMLGVTEWVCDGQTIWCETHRSPEPWNVHTQQRIFCTVHMRGGVKPLDVATSSHATAIASFVHKHWHGKVLPIVMPEYMV
jgi:hypothetical protein